jgi:hypothetical protein
MKRTEFLLFQPNASIFANSQTAILTYPSCKVAVSDFSVSIAKKNQNRRRGAVIVHVDGSTSASVLLAHLENKLVQIGVFAFFLVDSSISFGSQ